MTHKTNHHIHVVTKISTSFLFVAEWHSIAWICHFLPFHLSVSAHWNSCHFFTIMNNACRNIYIQFFGGLFFFFLWVMWKLCLNFEELPTISQSDCKILLSQQQLIRVQFHHICYWFVLTLFFYNSFLNWYEIGISLWFWFAFPWWLIILSIFPCAHWPFIYLLWRTVYSNSLPIF